MSTKFTGADIDEALDALDSPDFDDVWTMTANNGGLGEFEEDITPRQPRWLFPRFAGAEDIGSCENHEGVHTRITKGKTKCGETFAADMGNMYLSRSGIGPHDTDVETLVAWLDAPRNVVGATLLLGDPGTGKTSMIEAAVTRADRTLTTVVCTPDHTKDSLFMRFVGEGRGDEMANGERSPFTLGPIPYAAKHGHTLYLDEFMLLVDGVKPLVYPLADGRRFLPEGNVDGTAMEVHPDFRLVLSSNPLVRGASLPEPVASRCASTTLTVETSADMLHDLGLDDSVIMAWQALVNAGLWRPQIRELRMADYWLPLDRTQAASALVPEHCPESQRKEVRDIVTGLLGGDLRADGRLVVS